MTAIPPARKKPVTAKGQSTQRQLLAAAEVVFGSRGYAGTSIAEITRHAGVGLGTFYIYYANKEAVFVELVEEMGARMMSFVGERIATHSDRIARQRAAFRGFFEFAAQNPHIYRLLRQAEEVDHAAYRRYYQTLASAYARGLEAAMAEGAVGRYDPETLAWILMGIADFVGLRYVVWADQGTPDHVIDDVVAFVEAGLKRGT